MNQPQNAPLDPILLKLFLLALGIVIVVGVALLGYAEYQKQAAQAAQAAAQATRVAIANNAAIAQATATEQAVEAQATASEGQQDAIATADAAVVATQTAIAAESCVLGFSGSDLQIQVIGGGGVQACQILQRQGGALAGPNGRSVFLVPALNTALQLVCSAEDHGGTVNVYDSGLHVMGSWYCSHIGQPGF